MYVPTVLTQPPAQEMERELARLAARWSRARRNRKNPRTTEPTAPGK